MLDLLARSIVPFVRGALAGAVVGFVLAMVGGLAGVETSWWPFVAGVAIGSGVTWVYATVGDD